MIFLFQDFSVYLNVIIKFTDALKLIQEVLLITVSKLFQLETKNYVLNLYVKTIMWFFLALVFR